MSVVQEKGAMEVQSTSSHSRDSSRMEEFNAQKAVHTDGTVTYVANDAVGGDLHEMPKGYYRSWQFLGTVTAVCLANNCAYLGWVLPANTLSLINEDIGPSENLNWVATAWTLGSAIGFLMFGRLSDIFGRKWIIQMGMVLGLVGCIIGATASTIEVLIAAMLCNGLSAASQLSFGIVLGELVPNKQRGPISCLVFLSSFQFAVFGPIIARSFILNTAAGWRWSYYLGIIISGVTIVLYQVCYFPPTYKQLHVQGKSQWRQFMALDFLGIFLFCAGVALFLIGLSWGGQAYPWKSVEVICTLVIGGVTLIAFVFWEAYGFKGTPLMPPRLFKNIGFVSITVCAMVGAMVYYGLTVLWPSILGVYTTDDQLIGWQSSVVGGGVLLGQLFGGFGLSYIPKVKIQTVVMSCLSMAFVTSLSSIGPDTHNLVIGLGVMACFFIGYVDNITFPGVTLVIEPQDIGLATGVLGCLRAIGGAIAQSLYVTILQNKIAEYMVSYVAAAAVKAGLPEKSVAPLLAAVGAGSDITKIPGVTTKVATVVGEQTVLTYTDSFKMVFYATIPFSVILILAACLVPDMEEALKGKVARKLQHTSKEVSEERKEVA